MTAALDPAIHAALGFYRGYLRVFAASRMAPRLSPAAPVRLSGYDLDLEVVGREQVADDAVALTLRGDGPLPVWTPGAHLDVVLPSGAQRQYSLCGDLADRTHYRITVRLIPDGGGGSRELHESVAVGDRLTVRGPRQAFHLVPEPSYVFIAGGIGITPILPMVRAAAATGADWRLVYLGRSRTTLPFLDELTPHGDRVEIRTDDEQGVPDLARLVESIPIGTPVYMCGPTALMEQTRHLLVARDPRARFHSERFSAPPVVGGSAFTVRFARSGREIAVAAEESALTAIRRAVPGVAYSCQQGFCGTCKLAVLDGSVEHRDNRLLDSERTGHFLPCVSRGDDTLVVDL
jgi:ferredoxin-NADP reductase